MSRSLPLYFYFLLLCGLIAANISVYQIIFAPRVVKISVFEVGKGRASLVRSSSGKTLLIDTGPDASILRALGTVLPEWERSVDAVLLTSAKAGFAGGLPILESRYDIKTIQRVGDLAAPYGSVFVFDDTARITVLAPGEFSVSYGAESFTISSTTAPKTYTLK